MFPPSPTDFGSGVTQVVHNIGIQLVKRGHKVDIYTASVFNRPWGEFQTESRIKIVYGMRVFYFPYNIHYLNFFLTPTIMSFAEKFLKEYDVIHIHDSRSFQGIVVAHYAKKFRIPYVIHSHGSLKKTSNEPDRMIAKIFMDNAFGYKIVRNASEVIALSQAEADQYKALLIPEEKITLISNGINLDHFAKLPNKGLFRKKLKISCEQKIILSFGRINKSKGISFLVDAFTHLKLKGKCENCVLVISGNDDGFLKELRRMVRSSEITGSVFFTGGLSELEKVAAFVDSDIVVNVEPQNVFGLVPLEAAACSTPVIVSKGNAVSKIVSQGKFGFVVKYPDINELSAIIFHILENDQLQKEMGARGRAFIFKNYDWDRLVSKIEKVYEHAIFNAQNR